jgi:hypothetical protein
VLRKATPQAPPTLFGQFQKVNSPKVHFALTEFVIGYTLLAVESLMVLCYGIAPSYGSQEALEASLEKTSVQVLLP